MLVEAMLARNGSKRAGPGARGVGRERGILIGTTARPPVAQRAGGIDDVAPSIVDRISTWKSNWADQNLTNNARDADYVGVGMWGDSAVYGVQDSLFLLLFNMLSNTLKQIRHPLVVFPKAVVCKCGCKGKHTFDSVLSVYVWAMQSWASGTLPARRHDGVPMKDSRRPGDKNRYRRFLKRRNLRARGACVEKRGDWSWLKQFCGVQVGKHTMFILGFVHVVKQIVATTSLGPISG